MREGLFREDLYHRLNVIRLRLPSLRERSEDIPILARHFLAQSAHQLGVEAKRLSPQAMEFLSKLELPGNVRQLENLCNWITVMAPGQTVEVKDLPQDLVEQRAHTDIATSSSVAAPQSLSVPTQGVASDAALASSGQDFSAMTAEKNWITLLETEAAQLLSQERPEVMDILGRQFEAALIKVALKHTHGRKNDAAVRLGIGRNTITRKIQELGIGGAEDD